METIEEIKFKSPNEFSQYIEQLAILSKISYMDAVLKYCEDHMIEPEDVAMLINKSLKSKLENDFRELNYLPRRAQLDL